MNSSTTNSQENTLTEEKFNTLVKDMRDFLPPWRQFGLTHKCELVLSEQCPLGDHNVYVLNPGALNCSDDGRRFVIMHPGMKPVGLSEQDIAEFFAWKAHEQWLEEQRKKPFGDKYSPGITTDGA